ncbi:chemotaxis protein CheW [Chamaesiphon sp.]|uniref:chemotaxis protein CheW n=1 Tax=Chamaesiphon sp. TaxID=2814140 RepID=UPI003593633D
MAIYSPLRSRRLAAAKTEATLRLITFKLDRETFALPLASVHRVTTLDAPGQRGQRLYGDPHGTGVSLTTFQGRELVVIDVGQRIFGKPQLLHQQQREAIAVPTDQPEPKRIADLIRYLLILQPEPDRLIGLPIDSPPSIQSIQVAAFQPLPEIYRQHGNIHCVSSLSIESPDRQSIFLLDVASLT